MKQVQNRLEMDTTHLELKDKEITRIYNKAYGHEEERAKNSELAEEMIAASAIHDERDNS